MSTRYLFCLVALLFWGYSCSQTNKATSSSSSTEVNFDELDIKTGKTIVQSVCFSCHDPENSKMDRIAPPMELVKRNYIAISASEREFINRITSFVLTPTEEQAKLHEEVEEFGLMDPLGYSRKEIQSAAMYIYRTELERPDWVDSKNSPE